MNVACWILASLLALVYLYSGGIEILRTREQLRRHHRLTGQLATGRT